MFDQNGKPSGDTVFDDSVEQPEQNTILQTPEQPDISYASLIAGYMSAFTSAARILIDPFLRIFLGATNAGFVTPFNAEGEHKIMTIKPVVGQDGRSLAWEQTARQAGFDADLGDALKAVVDPPTARPKYRVESLVAALLRAVPDDFQGEATAPVIEVDQADGSIKIHYFTDAPGEARAVIQDAAVGDGDNGAKVILEDVETDGGPAPLVFEGGET